MRDMSGVPWNDRNDALSCDRTEFSMSSVIALLASRYSTNCFPPIAVAPENLEISEISDLASKSFSIVSISSVSCANLALSPEMLVSSVEILAL